MRRQLKNPFYIVLGFIGFTFTITSASYCLSVLRGVRPQSTLTEQITSSRRDNGQSRHKPFTGQLIILAIATVGAVAVDHVNGQKKTSLRHSKHPTDNNDPESKSPLEAKRS